MKIETLVLSEYQSNCYIVTVDDLGIVIDPGEPSPEILDLIGNRKVPYILNTHCHPDHIGGVGFVRERCGAKLFLHPDDERIFSFFMGEKLKPDGYLKEGDRIEIGGVVFEVLHTPGHSPGSVVFRVESERVLFTGDLIFAGSIGRTDFPGSDPQAMARSLQRILDLPGDYKIYSGHGPVTTLAMERWTNPFLQDLTPSPSPWPGEGGGL
ncbi:MBL fold metallo-hydrolase [Candidatus Acetothermia bacterium]|jgi:glyoxylase-like metal-dependent hydrolase (beta-lactamase superfamily II)|nr:MBL fold metallo-hydrolase [Candidatus Acetothermia bacterium]MCI2432554.1 MBL fold metallo-hydrolase [Candidatus Acetothermia bacterium]MCI2435869.1 MBL fold metallo-hydrolase [Candidatus Acetothermia bacterium]